MYALMYRKWYQTHTQFEWGVNAIQKWGSVLNDAGGAH